MVEIIKEFEGQVHWVSAKAKLIEMTLGGKYWVPKKCILSMEASDPYGNFLFSVNTWWATKRPDFEAVDE